VIHPLAGQGVNLGLLDAAALCDVLAGGVAEREDPGAARLLRRYEQLRLTDDTLMSWSMSAFNEIFARGPGPGGWLAARLLGLAGASGYTRRLFARRAMGLNFLLLLALAAVPAACAGTIAYLSRSSLVVHPLLFSCPAYSFELSVDAKYKWEAGHFWSSIGVTHALTWLLVVLASKRLPGSWQEQPSEPSKIRWREFWQMRAYGTPAKRASLRKRLLDVNPFFWLAARSWFKPMGVWLALVFVGAGGGVNSAAIQIARLAGCRVFVVGSDARKLELAAALGADVLIDRSQVDWGRQVYQLTQKRGVDVVVDNVIGTTLMTSLRSARRGGRILTVGNTAGPKVELDNRFMFKPPI